MTIAIILEMFMQEKTIFFKIFIYFFLIKKLIFQKIKKNFFTGKKKNTSLPFVLAISNNGILWSFPITVTLGLELKYFPFPHPTSQTNESI